MPQADASDGALELPREWLARLRAEWTALADLAVWGELASAQLGALPRFRRRVLELGEKLAALNAPRAWIPRPRERLKSALAAALAAREALAQCEQASAPLDRGAARDALAQRLAALRATLLPPLEARAERWAQLLDAAVGQSPEE